MVQVPPPRLTVLWEMQLTQCDNCHLKTGCLFLLDHHNHPPARWFPPPPVPTTVLHGQCLCSCKCLMSSLWGVYGEYLGSFQGVYTDKVHSIWARHAKSRI